MAKRSDPGGLLPIKRPKCEPNVVPATKICDIDKQACARGGGDTHHPRSPTQPSGSRALSASETFSRWTISGEEGPVNSDVSGGGAEEVFVACKNEVIAFEDFT